MDKCTVKTATKTAMPYSLTETRGSAPENKHSISVSLWTRDTLAGDEFCLPAAPAMPMPGHVEPVMAAPWVFARSTTKPFQAIPLLARHPNLPLDQVALCCASHAGSADHTQQVTALLSQAGLTKAALQCGSHHPVDAATREALIRRGHSPSTLHHNCSGKHAGMLLCCTLAKWPVDTYLHLQHPLQQAILDTLVDLTGCSQLQTAIDGCSAPTFYMPLSALARLYYQLAAGHSACLRQQQAMQAYPVLLGGVRRIDTGIIQATHGQVLAKVGADGVMALAHMPSQTGVAIKVWSGSEAARNHFTLWWLAQQGWLTHPHPAVARWQSTDRVNAAGMVVGHYNVI
jgi:L-asparaginase II